MNKQKAKKQKSKKPIRLDRRLSTNDTENYDLFVNELMNELNQHFCNILILKRNNTIYRTNHTNGRNYKYLANGHYLESTQNFILKLHPVESGVNLFDLKVCPLHRRKGICTQILRIMISISDKYNIPVYLIPIETEDVSIDILRNIYHKFGFKRERDNIYWKYSPKINCQISDIIDTTRVKLKVQVLEEIQLKAA